MRLNTLLGVVTAAAGLACVAQACDNTDLQVKIYRYSGTSCTGEETVASYQSGMPLRVEQGRYKIFTCCDDMKTVSVLDSATSTTTVVADECLTEVRGAAWSRGAVAWRGGVQASLPALSSCDPGCRISQSQCRHR